MGYEEIYWTEDYYKYALLIQQKKEENNEEVLEICETKPTDAGNDTPDDTR
jgi:hypothetical protein